MQTRKKHGNEIVRYFSTRMRPGTDKAEIYALYRGNISAMVKKARGRGVALLLSTVAYNRVIPPLDPGKAAAMHKKGMDLMREGKYKEALAMMNEAHNAEEIPVSANETSNGIIRSVAAGHNAPLLDADAAVIGQAPGGIPGSDLFLDHCHLRDNTSLGKLFQEAIRSEILKRKS